MSTVLPDYLQVVADKINNLENEVRSLEEKNREQSTSIIHLEHETKSLKEESELLKGEKKQLSEASGSEITQLKEVNLTLSEQLRESNSKNEDLNASDMSQSGQLSTFQGEINSLKITIEALRQRNDHLLLEQNQVPQNSESKVVEESEYTKLKKELATLKIEKAVLVDQNQQFKEMHSKLGEEKLAAVLKANSVLKEIEKLKLTDEELSGENRFLIANKERLDRENSELLKENKLLSEGKNKIAPS